MMAALYQFKTFDVCKKVSSTFLINCRLLTIKLCCQTWPRVNMVHESCPWTWRSGKKKNFRSFRKSIFWDTGCNALLDMHYGWCMHFKSVSQSSSNICSQIFGCLVCWSYLVSIIVSCFYDNVLYCITLLYPILLIKQCINVPSLLSLLSLTTWQQHSHGLRDQEHFPCIFFWLWIFEGSMEQARGWACLVVSSSTFLFIIHKYFLWTLDTLSR